MRVHVGKEVFVIRESLLQLEEILDPRRFIRVSRGAIVNVDWIREVQSWFQGEFAILLESGAQVNTTRSYRDSFKRLLEREPER